MPHPENLDVLFKKSCPSSLTSYILKKMKMLGQKFEIYGDKADNFCSEDVEARYAQLITGQITQDRLEVECINNT